MCSGGDLCPIDSLVVWTPYREFIPSGRASGPWPWPVSMHPSSLLFVGAGLRSNHSRAPLDTPAHPRRLVAGPASQHHGPDTNCGVDIRNSTQAAPPVVPCAEDWESRPVWWLRGSGTAGHSRSPTQNGRLVRQPWDDARMGGGRSVRSPMAVSGSSRMDTQVGCRAVFTLFLTPAS